MDIDHTRIGNALAHRRRHAEVEDEDGDKVEEGRKHHGLPGLQNPCGHHRGDRIGRIMEAIHEVEHQGHGDQHHDSPQCYRNIAHVGAPDQEFSRMMASSLITSRTSGSSRNSLLMAERITRSASDSRRSISSQVLRAASATGWSAILSSSCTASRRRSQHFRLRSVRRLISSVMTRTSYRAMVSAESWIRSATSSMVLISEWICSRSIGVMNVLWIRRLTSWVTRSAACSAASTSWLYFSRR